MREAQEAGKILNNALIKNVFIQGQLQRFMGINGYSFKGVTIKGLKLENIQVEKEPLKQSWIYTKDSNSVEINFDKVVFEDRLARESDFKTSGDVNLVFE